MAKGLRPGGATAEKGDERPAPNAQVESRVDGVDEPSAGGGLVCSSGSAEHTGAADIDV
ncbi:hypothetical protein EJ06DRAFT_534570 [Trichodelitschia bisporula]|uniref:Uncharacterized protein n=1 Tax=Trichodelitschia bisporula TaxID=703511 RepID=A0A6G1HJ04_9PEZI|nr:hypothetical protein EJ06DRAFT_534570 [Trichodelitschia bisporula]